MSGFLLSKCALILLAFLRVVSAQVVQDDWLAPSLPDASTTITIGDNYKIQWDANLVTWFPQYASQADPSDCSLWITESQTNSSYQNLIQRKLTFFQPTLPNPLTKAGNVNVSSTLSIDWVVEIPDSQLSETTEYTFRFLPLGAAYTNDSASQISSPRVIVKLGASSATTSSAPASSASQTASSTTTSQTSSATSATASSASSSSSTSAPIVNKSSGLSGGAIAGIVVGAVGGIALLGLGALMLLRRNRRASPPAAATTEPLHSPAPAYTMSEMDNSYAKHSAYTHPSELDSSPR